MKAVKAHCAPHNKWFALKIEDGGKTREVVDFINLTPEQAEGFSTQTDETSFRVASTLRKCCKCSSSKVGTCSHIRDLGLCEATYSYQCLFCNQLKISRSKAINRYTEWVGTNFIPDAAQDMYGNAKGSQYDLAKDGSFSGFKVFILCLYTGENIVNGMQGAVGAMRKKGFEVEVKTSISPRQLREKLRSCCQLWVISNRVACINNDHLEVIQDFYDSCGGLYIFGDNDPYYADANLISQKIFGVKMSGNMPGDKVISVQSRTGKPGIIQGHPITTGISNFYEGVTIAIVQTNHRVKPLVISSENQVVTAIVDENGRRALIDGGFTRLFVKWDSAGTDRFIVNAAAWLANEENGVGGEISFT